MSSIFINTKIQLAVTDFHILITLLQFFWHEDKSQSHWKATPIVMLSWNVCASCDSVDISRVNMCHFMYL